MSVDGFDMVVDGIGAEASAAVGVRNGIEAETAGSAVVRGGTRALTAAGRAEPVASQVGRDAPEAVAVERGGPPVGRGGCQDGPVAGWAGYRVARVWFEAGWVSLLVNQV